MIISCVRVRKIHGAGKLVGIAEVTIDNLFVVHDIKILRISETDKLFLAMPSKKLPNGNFTDIAHPISAEGRAMLEALIIPAFLELEDRELISANFVLNEYDNNSTYYFMDYTLVQVGESYPGQFSLPEDDML